MTYVLTLWGLPVAVADREERLNEHMADPKYTAIEQAHMRITADVPYLT